MGTTSTIRLKFLAVTGRLKQAQSLLNQVITHDSLKFALIVKYQP